jgi:hypothetical protein
MVFNLKEEHRLMLFENRVLRRIFGPTRDEVTGGWRQMYSDGLHCLYSSCIMMIRSRRVSWAGYVSCMREMRNVYRILVRKPKRKRPPGRPEYRYGDKKWIIRK